MGLEVIEQQNEPVNLGYRNSRHIRYGQGEGLETSPSPTHSFDFKPLTLHQTVFPPRKGNPDLLTYLLEAKIH